MAKALTSVLLQALLIFAFAAGASGADASGEYETWVFGSRVKAYVKQSGKNISGVAHIYAPFGKKNTYHFTGKIDRGRVVASHFQGHFFQGSYDGQGRISGVITTKNGHRINISAPRR